ncbi:MAG TPA: hypothetical protein VH593_15825, partial [Ktedonobacteraceae bacterium]
SSGPPCILGKNFEFRYRQDASGSQQEGAIGRPLPLQHMLVEPTARVLEWAREREKQPTLRAKLLGEEANLSMQKSY